MTDISRRGFMIGAAGTAAALVVPSVPQPAFSVTRLFHEEAIWNGVPVRMVGDVMSPEMIKAAKLAFFAAAPKIRLERYGIVTSRVMAGVVDDGDGDDGR